MKEIFEDIKKDIEKIEKKVFNKMIWMIFSQKWIK